MTKPITAAQFADLYCDEFSPKGHCCLCGNKGTIDTRGKMFTPAGFECGALVYCVCPNGRALKRQCFLPQENGE